MLMVLSRCRAEMSVAAASGAELAFGLMLSCYATTRFLQVHAIFEKSKEMESGRAVACAIVVVDSEVAFVSFTSRCRSFSRCRMRCAIHGAGCSGCVDWPAPF